MRLAASAAIGLLLPVAVTACTVLAPTSPPASATPPPTASASPRSPEPVPSPTPTPGASAAASPAASPADSSAPPGGPSLEALVGQKLIVAMSGLRPSAAIVDRIRSGQVGGVILFRGNIDDASQVRSLTAQLQAAAAGGGQPPLLIATDQEGGAIKRIPWIPPTLSPPQIGATGDPAVARDQGRQTGLALRDLGINVDLAPVADLPDSPDSILDRQGRTFTLDADRNVAMVSAFAEGLASVRVLPVLKHFPGLGLARHNTDEVVVTLDVSRAGLAAGLRPYERMPPEAMVMLSNAVYTRFDGANAAGWSPTIVRGLLREDVGFAGVSMTDSLTGAAKARGVSEARLSEAAAGAGTDLILVTSDEAATTAVHDELLAAARQGRISRSTLRASYDRILSLKARLPGG